ncbi:MAG: hypothetical protein R3A79_07645 [Nannocystaceae bacterium]
MVRALIALALALFAAQLGCAPGESLATASASAGTDDTDGTSTGIAAEGCGGDATGEVFVYAEGSLVDPSDPDRALWTTPRQACELAMIVDFDVAADGSIYVLSTAFLHETACIGACPWRYELRRLSAAAAELWTVDFALPMHEPRALRAVEGGVAVGGAVNLGADRRPWLARYDHSGALLWEETFAAQGQVTAVAGGPGDVVVAVGQLEDEDGDELWAVQRSADGASDWSFPLEDAQEDAALAVAVDAAGRVWIAGGREPSSDYPIPYYSPDDEYAWWDVFPESFTRDVATDRPFIALLDPQGSLLWLDEPEPSAPTWCTGQAIDLLPGGDAIMGLSWFGAAAKDVYRYAPDGAQRWSVEVTPDADAPDYVDLDALACDGAGRCHLLIGGHVVQLDDAGAVVGALAPGTAGTELALTPTNAPRVSQWRKLGAYYDSWHFPPPD